MRRRCVSTSLGGLSGSTSSKTRLEPRTSCVEALEVLYRKHAHQLRGYLRSLLRTTSELGLSTGAVADDLTHDTFLCALSSKACAEYDPNRDYSPYLRAIAHSRFIDAVRARR